MEMQVKETHHQVVVEGLLFPQWASDPHFNPFLRATWCARNGEIVITRGDDGYAKSVIYSGNGDMEVAFEFIDELASKMSTQWRIFEMIQILTYFKKNKPFDPFIRPHGACEYEIKDTTVFLRPLDGQVDEATESVHLAQGFCPLAVIHQVDYDVDLVDIANTVRVFYTCTVDGIVLDAETMVFP